MGWAWQEFFTATIGFIVPYDDAHGRAGILAVVKCIFALLVFFMGAYCEHWLQMRDLLAPRQSSVEGNLTTPFL